MCPCHRNLFGIRSRCNRTRCTVPSSIAVHGLAGSTGQFGLKSAQSAYIFRSAKIPVPVGSRMYIYFFLLDSELLTSVERFNENQKSYLQAKFNIGQASERKLDPEVVAKEMRRARAIDGERLFLVEEFLSPQQISSFFSRMAAKVRQQPVTDQDVLAVEEQQVNFCLARDSVQSSLRICHPIVVGTSVDQYDI